MYSFASSSTRVHIAHAGDSKSICCVHTLHLCSNNSLGSAPLYELTTFVGNKLGKYIAYDVKLSNEEKINKVYKLAKIYNSISEDKDYDVLVKVIKDTVKEVSHRSKLIGFSNQEIQTLEKLNNEINR